ncbi:hypothetical protein [Bradyrhizobium sp. STM 3562]|uniref:hypothetical protein n=1 Tax=Bradyrhizobium sp. STM 3562 TaxID=578924 RepID=UPI00388D5F11
MTGYRRNFMPGGAFFFTVNLAHRRLRLLTHHIDELRSAVREIRGRHPFTIDAIVVLPDHVHATRVRDWPYSSFRRMVALGLYPEDWAGNAGELSGEFGERS